MKTNCNISVEVLVLQPLHMFSSNKVHTIAAIRLNRSNKIIPTIPSNLKNLQHLLLTKSTDYPDYNVTAISRYIIKYTQNDPN